MNLWRPNSFALTAGNRECSKVRRVRHRKPMPSLRVQAEDERLLEVLAVDRRVAQAEPLTDRLAHFRLSPFEKLRRRPLLDHNPHAAVDHWTNDAHLPTCRETPTRAAC